MDEKAEKILAEFQKEQADNELAAKIRESIEQRHSKSIAVIGDQDRPVTEQDIADMQQALAAVALDPNLTIVTTSYSQRDAHMQDWAAAHLREHGNEVTPEAIAAYDEEAKAYDESHQEREWDSTDS